MDPAIYHCTTWGGYKKKQYDM